MAPSPPRLLMPGSFPGKSALWSKWQHHVVAIPELQPSRNGCNHGVLVVAPKIFALSFYAGTTTPKNYDIGTHRFSPPLNKK